MATFVVVHGAADSAWSWHLVARELRASGHDVVVPDLPCEDDTPGFPEYADVVVDAIGHRTDLIVVGHSLGGFTAPLVADRLPVRGLVLLTAMIPQPGEPANDWWANTGYTASSAAGTTGDNGPIPESDQFFHDVPSELAAEAKRHGRGQSGAPMTAPWALLRWPEVPTRFILCTEDRFFPPAFMRRVVDDRLPGVVPDEVAGGHMAMLSRPVELAEMLDRYAWEMGGAERAG